MIELTKKQKWAMHLMCSNSTKFIGYGGGAGGGKSILGCFALMTLAIVLKGSKWFIGRDSLKDTRESVLFTFRKVASMQNIRGWKYRDNHIYFDNGSEIEFIDLSFYPQKDPLYERFGSKEYTGGWIEEAGNVHPLAYDVLKTRINRWYNLEFGYVGKILITFNPKKNWVEDEFYRPFKSNKQTKDTVFIPALYSDNKHLPAEYVDNLLAIKDKSTRERLLHGNFEYDDDPTALMSYEHITAIWSNDHIIQDSRRYIVGDIARYGSDKAVLSVWQGLRIIELIEYKKSSTVKIQNTITHLRGKYRIPASHCIVDEDGVGGGVVDNCRILGFENGSSSFNPVYARLKDECGYLLSECIHRIDVAVEVSQSQKQYIEQELGQLKTWKLDDDKKLCILPKKEIKNNIGRSPDYLDMFIMRMYFELSSPAVHEAALRKAYKMLA